jgi:DNA-binding MarR family transcriptional regulator
MDQWMILTALSTQKGVNQMQVGNSCVRDKASITRLLDMLEAKQWVYRQTDTRDRRTKLVYLTPEGAEVREQALAIALHLERELAQMLGATEQQLSTALHILTRFGDHLENADSD